MIWRPVEGVCSQPMPAPDEAGRAAEEWQRSPTLASENIPRFECIGAKFQAKPGTK